MDQHEERRVDGPRPFRGRRLRGAAGALLALGLSGFCASPATGGEVQVYGRLVDVSTFHETATRPRLDGGQVVEFTFAVERVVSDDVEESIGRRLTMFLPLREAAARADVQGVTIDTPTYVTLYTGSPVRRFRFHSQMESPGGAGVEDAEPVR
jgi:hypothetical protein